MAGYGSEVDEQVNDIADWLMDRLDQETRDVVNMVLQRTVQHTHNITGRVRYVAVAAEAWHAVDAHTRVRVVATGAGSGRSRSRSAVLWWRRCRCMWRVGHMNPLADRQPVLLFLLPQNTVNNALANHDHDKQVQRLLADIRGSIQLTSAIEAGTIGVSTALFIVSLIDWTGIARA